MIFEAGWVPKGWVRGEKLTMYANRDPSMAWVLMQVHFPPVSDNAWGEGSTAGVHFMRADFSDVKRWLRWWYEGNEKALQWVERNL